MKPGASDPFADDEETESAAEATATDRETAEDEAGNAPADAAASESSDADGADASAENGDEGTDVPAEFPYIYRRDKVKDERPDVHQLFVRDETDTLARDAERDLEKLLGEDVYRLDAREAIYLAGMRHLDEAADVLREWGYDR